MSETRNQQQENLNLEKQKLELEISELQLPWYKKPKYLSVMIPALLGTVTIFLTFFTTLIDKKVVNYEAKIEQLNVDKDSIQSIQKLYLDSINLAKVDLSKLRERMGRTDSALAQEKTKNFMNKVKFDSANSAFQEEITEASNDSERTINLQRNKIENLIDQIETTNLLLTNLESKFDDSVGVLNSKVQSLSQQFEQYKLTHPMELTTEEYNRLLLLRQQRTQLNQPQNQQQQPQVQQQQQQLQGGN